MHGTEIGKPEKADDESMDSSGKRQGGGQAFTPDNDRSKKRRPTNSGEIEMDQEAEDQSTAAFDGALKALTFATGNGDVSGSRKN